MKNIRTCAIIVFWSVLVLGLAGSATAGKLQQELVQESAVEQIMKRGTLKVGMSTFVPWAMKDKTGKLIGFEIDVATRLAEDMGVKVEFVPTKWAGIIPALLIPYDYAGQSLVANKKLAAGFSNLQDFNRPDVVIAARLGSTAADAAKRFMPKAKKRFFDDEAQVIQEVVNGKAHAAVASAPLPAFQAIKYPDRLFLPFTGTFTKEAKGWLAERKHYWFETKDWEGMLK